MVTTRGSMDLGSRIYHGTIWELWNLISGLTFFCSRLSWRSWLQHVSIVVSNTLLSGEIWNQTCYRKSVSLKIYLLFENSYQVIGIMTLQTGENKIILAVKKYLIWLARIIFIWILIHPHEIKWNYHKCPCAMELRNLCPYYKYLAGITQEMVEFMRLWKWDD